MWVKWGSIDSAQQLLVRPTIHGPNLTGDSVALLGLASVLVMKSEEVLHNSRHMSLHWKMFQCNRGCEKLRRAKLR